MHPKAHRSDSGPQKSSDKSYGAIYKGVPTKVALLTSGWSIISSSPIFSFFFFNEISLYSRMEEAISDVKKPSLAKAVPKSANFKVPFAWNRKLEGWHLTNIYFKVSMDDTIGMQIPQTKDHLDNNSADDMILIGKALQTGDVSIQTAPFA